MRSTIQPSALVIFAIVAANWLGQPCPGQCDFNLTAHSAHGAVLNYGHVTAMTIFDDGAGDGPALIVGGAEVIMDGGGAAYHVAKWSPSQGWSAMGGSFYSGASPGVIAFVRALTVFNGELYAGGQFMWAARWDGSHWVNLRAGLPSPVIRFQAFDDGSGPALYAITQSSAGGLYRLNGSSWVQAATFNGAIRAMTVYDDGSGQGPALIVGGNFTEVEGVAAARIARWNGTPGPQGWSALGAGVEGGIVRSLLAHEHEGKPALFVSGAFTQAGGSPAEHVAMWTGADADGNWTPLPSIDQFYLQAVHSLTLWDDGNGAAIYAAAFSQSPDSGDTSDGFYRLDPQAQIWTFVGATYRIPSSGIGAIAEFDDSAGEPGQTSLYIGGYFATFGGMPIPTLVRRPPQAPGLSATFTGLPAAPDALAGRTNANATFDDGAGNGPAIYAGGRFTNLGVPSPGTTLIARFDGDSWTSIADGIANDAVRAMLKFDDGSSTLKGGAANDHPLYVGGSFTTIAGAAANNLAKWDGQTWSQVGGGVNGSVHALCEHDDGSASAPALFVAGEFTSVGDPPLPVNNIAKWDGQNWTALGAGLTGGPGSYANSVYALASFDDGSGGGPALYAGGGFASAGGAPAMRIAKWNGQAWSDVGGGVSGGPFIAALHVHDDGSGAQLYAGGVFSHAGGVAAHRIARWDGKQWSVIGEGLSNSSLYAVMAMTTFNEGSGPQLFATGTGHVQALRWNGSQWAQLSNSNWIMHSGALHAFDETLYLGGTFPVFSKWSSGGGELAIANQSHSGAFNPGSTVLLGVNVTHGGAVSYQWSRNGQRVANTAAVSGAATDRLKINNISGSYEGTYRVTASNDCTVVVSDPIFIDVIGTCPGDIAPVSLAPQTVGGDGKVDVDDLLAVLGAWGPCPTVPPLPTSCPADIAPLGGEGTVDIHDLLTILMNWGACP